MNPVVRKIIFSSGFALFLMCCTEKNQDFSLFAAHMEICNKIKYSSNTRSRLDAQALYGCTLDFYDEKVNELLRASFFKRGIDWIFQAKKCEQGNDYSANEIVYNCLTYMNSNLIFREYYRKHWELFRNRWYHLSEIINIDKIKQQLENYFPPLDLSVILCLDPMLEAGNGFGFYLHGNKYVIVAAKSLKSHTIEEIVFHEMAHPYVYRMIHDDHLGKLGLILKEKEIKMIEELIVRYLTVRLNNLPVESDLKLKELNLPSFLYHFDFKNSSIHELVDIFLALYCRKFSDCTIIKKGDSQ